MYTIIKNLSLDQLFGFGDADGTINKLIFWGQQVNIFKTVGKA